MKTEWELYPICQLLEPELKIFQIRQVCAKKIDNDPWTFLPQKLHFMALMINTNFVLK